MPWTPEDRTGLTPVVSPTWREPIGVARPVELLLLAVVGGLVVGLLYYLVSLLFELVVVFPLVAGVLVGILVGRRARRRKVAHALVVWVCGFLGGTLCYGTRLYLESAHIVQLAMDELAQAGPADEGAQDLRVYLLDRTRSPVGRFVEGLALQAELGVTIGHLGTDLGRPMQGVGFYLLILFEWLACALPAGLIPRDDVQVRLCPECGDWCDITTLFYATEDGSATLRAAVEEQDWPAAQAISDDVPTVEAGAVRVNLEACPSGHAAWLSLRRKDGRYLQTWAISEAARERLEEAVAADADGRPV